MQPIRLILFFLQLLPISTGIAMLQPCVQEASYIGVVPNPISTQIFPLIQGQRSITASPLGSPTTTAKMLDFAVRHNIQPIVEVYPFEQINEAIDCLRSGKAHYRLVLKH